MRTGIGLQALAVWLWDRGVYEVEKRVSRNTEPAE
jgi:hypothetical protein